MNNYNSSIYQGVTEEMKNGAGFGGGYFSIRLYKDRQTCNLYLYLLYIIYG
jgi:hypothetical protein